MSENLCYRVECFSTYFQKIYVNWERFNHLDVEEPEDSRTEIQKSFATKMHLDSEILLSLKQGTQHP